MQGVPPVDRELDDRQVDGPDEGQDRDRAGGPGRLLDGVPEREDAAIHEEEHQHRGEPRVPDPVGAPHRLAPERAGDEADQRKGGADRGGGLLRHVGQGMAPDQGAERRGRHDDVEEQRQPGRRHVQEHDPHGLALLVIRRRHEQGQVEPDRQRQRGGAAEPGQQPAAEAHEAGRVGEIEDRDVVSWASM